MSETKFLSKEEILLRVDLMFHPRPTILTAMDIYANQEKKKEAIEFAEWAFKDENPFMWHEDAGKWIQACGNSTSWTTEQLYSLYKGEPVKEKQPDEKTKTNQNVRN